MAKLKNVKVAPDLTTIEYDGDTYYRLADGQEPQDGDLFYVVDGKLIGTEAGDVFAVFTDPVDGELTYINNDDEECFAVKYAPAKCRIFFRKGPGKTESPKSLPELIAEKRAELAELEAKLREELRPGALAVVVKNASKLDAIPVGSVVKIVDRAFGSVILYEEMYDCESVLDGTHDNILTEDLVPITLEDARARLYAEVDRRLAQLT